MTDCPGEASLRDYLSGHLSGPAGATLSDHVETCADCQNRLEILTARPSLVLTAPPAPRPDFPTEESAGPADAPGTLFAERYRLREKLGEGGMGTVWAADQLEPVRRAVAVKVIRASLGGRDVLARFEVERQALALMGHPGIARVHDGGVAPDGRPFFVMELIQGVPITAYCDARQLTIWQRLELFVPVCRAIQHAHQKGIIHRDIKPSNVLVAVVDDQPVPKVIDFGIAKATGGALADQARLTRSGELVGTPQYMSPEQAALDSLDIDTRSDVYSLGVLLYELLTGTPPFAGKELAAKGLLEVLRVVVQDEPPRPSAKLAADPALPRLAADRGTDPRKLIRLLRSDLDWVVLKALEKDRARRYETVGDLAADVRHYLTGKPVQAHPPSATYRLGKYLKRNKGAILAATLVLLALLGGMVGMGWGLVHARRATETERAARLEVEDERRIALAVREFLQIKLLGQADTRQQADTLLRAGGTLDKAKLNPTVRELLDRAARELAADKIEESFPAQPKLQAELLKTVGITYRGVGEFESAIDHLDRAAKLHQAHQGAGHPETWNAQYELAAAYLAAGKTNEAIGRFEQVRDAWMGLLGPRHVNTLNALNYLALAYRDAGKHSQAIELFEQVRDARVQVLGADHADTLVTLNNLALAYRAAGRLRETIELYEQARETMVRQRGADHPDTLTMLNGLAGAYRAAAKLPQAIELYEQVREARVRVLGADHPSTLTTLNNLALAYQDAGKLPQAIAVIEQVRDVFVDKLGPDHPSTLTTLVNLAAVYHAAKKRPQAIELLEQVRAAAVPKLGAEHPLTLSALNNLAAVYLAGGSRPQAIAILEQVREARVRKLGADHPDSLATLADLGSVHRAAGDLPKALAYFEQAALGLEKRGFLDEQAGRTIPNAVAAFEAANQFDRAEAWQRKWLAAVTAKSGSGSQAHARALAGLGRNLVRQQKWAEAEEVLSTCVAAQEKLAPDDAGTHHARAMLGEALCGQQRHAEAEPLLLAAYAGLKPRAQPLTPGDRARLAETLERLVKLYEATGKSGEAERWRKELGLYKKR